MRKLSLFAVLAAVSFPLAAQQQDSRSSGTEQQQTRSGQNTQNAVETPDEELLERVRVEGAAGGTRPVPPEKRAAVNADAGPHVHHDAPKPTKLPRNRPIGPAEE